MRRLAALVALMLVVAACSGGTEGTGGQLEGTRWVLRSYAENGSQVLLEGDAYADATFTGGRVSGFGGCSTYDALARSTGRALLVSAARTTLQSCGETADAFQSTYLGLLQESRAFTSRLDTLTIFGPDRTALLVYDAGPGNPLLGHWNIDSFADAPGSQVAPLEGTSLTATFRLTNVSGSSGCNTYDGTYGTNGNVVAIGRLATTRMACPDDVMTQETAFLAALGGVAFVEPRGATLLLTDRSGNISVALSRPGAEPEATTAPATAEPSKTPEATATKTPKPTASPSPTPTASPTPKPTATATAAPSATPKPTAKPTAAPTAAPTPAPTVTPPSPLPATTTCAIDGAGGSSATISYPANWNTLAAPPAMACRYFDPEPITVPEDPLTLETAVMIQLQANLDYSDAVIAATDTGTWSVTTDAEFTVAGYPATLVEATSTNAASGTPVGSTRYAYLVDLGPNGTAFIQTTGTPGATFDTNTSTVDLIAAEVTISAPF
jgi:heat shock protein HslJ